MMHVALVSAHPTEADARRALGRSLPSGTPYLGVWTKPEPGSEPLHVFGPPATPVLLIDHGWTQEDA